MQMHGRDLLTLGDLAPDEIHMVLERAKALKNALHMSANRLRPLEGKAVALIFLKPSMRTRVSFEIACRQLGATPIVLGPGDAFSRGETVHDTVKVLERYVDAIVVRTFAQGHIEEIAEHARVPVVNALTDAFHPCQVLADLLTIQEKKGRLAGLTLAYVGDGNNMANTLLLGGALTGMRVRVASPRGFGPKETIVGWASEIATATGGSVEVGSDPFAAVVGADVVVTDTWASMGQEAEHDARIAAFRGFTVDPALMAQSAQDAIFMHCLPAHRGEEVVDAVIDADYSVVFDEAENRLHAQKAILSLLIG
ncbi:MAG: ornithine carbamoyltransferase [Coriobacteriia bacterium]